MDKVPQPFWAVALAAFGVALAFSALFKPSPENISIAVLGVARDIVIGALGAFAGHAAAKPPTP